MCRGGRMFAPTKVWRKWHKKINTNQKRYAVCSAVAASAVPALVMARGHRIQSVDEIPLVIEKDFQALKKTKAALGSLQALHLSSELRRCKVCLYLQSHQMTLGVVSCAFMFDIENTMQIHDQYPPKNYNRDKSTIYTQIHYYLFIVLSLNAIGIYHFDNVLLLEYQVSIKWS